jgi:hypothetical protein
LVVYDSDVPPGCVAADQSAKDGVIDGTCSLSDPGTLEEPQQQSEVTPRSGQLLFRAVGIVRQRPLKQIVRCDDPHNVTRVAAYRVAGGVCKGALLTKEVAQPRSNLTDVAGGELLVKCVDAIGLAVPAVRQQRE